jgi:thiol:disulfide interchange protein DsbD
MTNYIKLFLAFLFITEVSLAQIENPVHWKFTTKKTAENEYDLVFQASIDKGWHVYSQFLESDNGPIASTFTFDKNNNIQLVGKVSESKSITLFEKAFEMNVSYFLDKATFTQHVKVLKEGKQNIKGYLNFQTCDESKCLPPTDVDFSFNVEGTKQSNTAEGSLQLPNSTPNNTDNANSSAADSNVNAEATATSANSDSSTSKATATVSAQNNDNATSEEPQSGSQIFILGLLAGLAALLTPCVFPMIPMNVSFFTKRSKNKAEGIKNASIFSLSIIVLYVSLGLLFTMAFGTDALHALSTNFYFNLFFFALLLIFAFSFLGAFEIVLPSSLVNKIDSQSDRGGIIGIFFMAFTLTLVSFSCTSGFIGPLLFSAGATGEILAPFLGMLGFSIGLALPFGLFAAFPGWLNSLPKSGGWLNSVKVTLGFLELALAFKFASNADLVVQANILTREIFIAIWIVVFALLGFYLLGKLKFHHDDELPKNDWGIPYLSVGRLMLAIISFSFTLYLIPGMWGAPLKLVSAFVPPDYYAESPYGLVKAAGGGSSAKSNAHATKENHCPNDLPCFHDYDEAMAYAKKVNKPLLIDFTGYACVNCRKMESEVWTNSEVDKRLRDDVVLVSLYVDDNNLLPESEWTEKKVGTETMRIKTKGSKWVYLEISKYQNNSQPLYVMLDHQENTLAQPTSYDPNVEKYIDWLDKGLEKFNAK